MLAGEVVLLGVVGLAVIALVTFMRRERITRAADLGESLYPLSLGLYRSCAFLVVLVMAFAVMVIVVLANSGTATGT